MLVQCSLENSIEISLSEDAVVDAIQIINKEQFSSLVKKFRIYSTNTYPSTVWRLLGEFEVKEDNKKWNTFQINNSWGRYIKFEWVESFETNEYCIVSQIKICGHSML